MNGMMIIPSIVPLWRRLGPDGVLFLCVLGMMLASTSSPKTRAEQIRQMTIKTRLEDIWTLFRPADSGLLAPFSIQPDWGTLQAAPARCVLSGSSLPCGA